MLPAPQLLFGWYILPLTSHLCNSLHACLWHRDTCFLSQHHPCICGASPGLLTYLWIKRGAQRRKACKCTFTLALNCTHIKGTSLRVAGRSGSSNTGCSLVRRADRGLRLSGSHSPLQVLLWNSYSTVGDVFSCGTTCTLLPFRDFPLMVEVNSAVILSPAVFNVRIT